MESIFNLLRADSPDEEKFVALMIIPKYVKINDTASVALVFEKMDFAFLSRLLVCVVDKNEMSADLMRIVAIRIISVFASFQTFASTSTMQEFIGPLIDCIGFFAEIKNLENMKDAFTTIARVLSDLVAECKVLEMNEARAVMLCSLTDKLEDNQLQNLVALYRKVMSVSSAQTTQHLLKCLARAFQNSQSALKILLLDFFIEYLATSPTDSINLKWTDPLSLGINTLLQNKMTPAITNSALTLIAMLVRFNGAKAFFAASDPSAKDLMLPFDKFLALTLHVVCAEIRVLVDDYKIPATGSFIEEIDETVSCVLPMSLETLDYILLYISSDLLDEDSAVDCELMLSIRTTLTEAFLSISAFLDEVYNKNFALLDNIIVFFAIRALATWYAEDSSTSKNEIIQLLPLLILSASTSFTCIPERMIEVLGSGFENITADKVVAAEFVKEGGHVAIIAYLENADAYQRADVVESLVAVLKNLQVNLGSKEVYKKEVTEITRSMAKMNV